MLTRIIFSAFFFFNDTATTEIYTLSLHDALPISYLAPADVAALAAALPSGASATRLGELGRVYEIGIAHVCTPVTVKSRMPSSACTQKPKISAAVVNGKSYSLRKLHELHQRTFRQ